MTDAAKIAQLLAAFSPGGEYEVCADDDCGHSECEVGRYVLEVVA